MSHHDYTQSVQIWAGDFSFASLIMVAMRQADTDNLQILSAGFPEIKEELIKRMGASGGLLEGERVWSEDSDSWIKMENEKLIHEQEEHVRPEDRTEFDEFWTPGLKLGNSPD